MRYQKYHSYDSWPRNGVMADDVWVYIESDDEGWATRVIEVHSDGRCFWFDETDRDELPEKNVLPVDEDDGFESQEITADEFLRLWEARGR